MITIPNLVLRVRTRFEQESSVRWTDEEIEVSIKEGVEDLSEATGFYERYVNIRSFGSQMYFDLRGLLPETAIIVTKIWSPGTNRWLIFTSPKTLDQQYQRWDAVRGGPTNWFIRGMNWLGIFPRLESGNSMRLYFQGIPDFISDLKFEEDYATAIEDYTLYDLQCQDGEVDKAILHWQNYMNREMALTSQIDKRVVRARTSSMSIR